MLGVDYPSRMSTPTFIIEPFFIRNLLRGAWLSHWGRQVLFFFHRIPTRGACVQGEFIPLLHIDRRHRWCLSRYPVPHQDWIWWVPFPGNILPVYHFSTYIFVLQAHFQEKTEILFRTGKFRKTICGKRIWHKNYQTKNRIFFLLQEKILLRCLNKSFR